MSPVSSLPDSGNGTVSTPADSRRASLALLRLEYDDNLSLVVDQNAVVAQIQQAGTRKTAAPARATGTAVGSIPSYVVDESTIAHPAPDDKNDVAKQVLARRAVLVGGTTDSTTPSVETASRASSEPSVAVIINRKRL